MTIEFEVADIIPASPETVYSAWLDSREHTQMTGSPAVASAVEGGRFEAWDGYIEGTNLELAPDARIVQLWRSTEFEPDDPDSRLEILFEAEGSGTRVTIRHTQLPDHGMQYKQGWIDAYFEPMKLYFAGGGDGLED